MASLKRQTFILTAANAASRGLGFVLRLAMARLLHPEALGLMELAGSVSMLALTPVAAGLPTAMSRLTAQRSGREQEDVLRAGLALLRRLALAVAPALLLLSPALGWLLGDLRTVPAIALAAPSVLLMGACGVYGGYFIGQQNMRVPAVNEFIEQGVRCALCIALMALASGRSLAVDAALPGLAGLFAGMLAVGLFYRASPMDQPQRAVDEPLVRELLRLSVPMMLARLCAAGLRTLNAVLLPVCLRRSGLTASAATAQYGLLMGMAMPLMLLPGVVTGALCTVSTPAISRLEGTSGLRRMTAKLSLTALCIGLAASAALFAAAEPLGMWLYQQPALVPLIRILCPVALLASLRQVQFGVIAGLGLQARSLTGTVLSSVVSLVLTACWAVRPGLRLYGAAGAILAGQAVGVLWNLALLMRAMRGKR